MSEEEEFEFRHRYEQEQAAQAPRAAAAPTDVEAGLNSAAKGLANLLNTPITLKNLAMMGLAKIPGVGDIPAVQDMANNPTPNYPMQAAEKVGFVRPDLAPQTGMQRMVDATVQGAVGGGPLGAVSGLVGEGVKEVTGNEKLGLAAGIAMALTPAGRAKLAQRATEKAAKARNPVREETIKEAMEAGFVIPPSHVNPSFGTNRLESFAGKTSVEQSFALKNQVRTNELVAEEIGLPAGTKAIDKEDLRALEREAAGPYRKVSDLSPTAAQALHDLTEARKQSKAWWDYHNDSKRPGAIDKAKKFDADASKFEQTIDNEARRLNEPGLMQELRDSRRLLGKINTVKRALNTGDGNVSPEVLGKMLDDGAPLTGNLEKIAKFNLAFEKVSREGAKVPRPQISGFDAVTSSMLAGGGFAAGGPMGLALGAIPLARDPVRNALATKMVQDRLLSSVNRTLPVVDFTEPLAKAGLAGRSLLDVMGAAPGEGQ